MTTPLARALASRPRVAKSPRSFAIADLFCGAGGTSKGACEAVEALGLAPTLTAINHWPVAIETHSLNHPEARHLCTGIDSVNPRDLYKPGELQLLWASPECTHHSVARGGKPIHEQSRATAWCVIRWADALLPPVILVENVPEFVTWGPLDSKGRPIVRRKGEIFHSWVKNLQALGYRVDWRVLCAADYGDPTTRRRLFVQCVRGRRKIVWPETTHAPVAEGDIFGRARRPWVGADQIIDWSLPMQSIWDRKRPLAANTLRRIDEGLREHGHATIIAMEHGGRALSIRDPLPTVTTAKGGAFGVAYLLPQQSGGALRPVREPVPTVSAAGAIGLIMEYYGNGVTHPISEPLPTVTCKDRFAFIQATGGDVLFRMLQPHELAQAQGFPRDYQFSGNKTEQVKQIGNAVPRHLARALVKAVLEQ